jgi:uncharacterized membrane protein YbhN (UPF0104 family)
VTTAGYKINTPKKSLLNWSALMRIAVTGSILAYLASKLDWAEMGKQLMQSDPFWLFIACFLVGASLIMAAVRWWLLLKVQGIHLPMRFSNRTHNDRAVFKFISL